MNINTFFWNTFTTRNLENQIPVLHQTGMNVSRNMKASMYILALMLLTNITWYSAWINAANAGEEKTLYLMEKASIYVTDMVIFEQKVREVSSKLEIPPEWLMAVMYSESRFNAAAENFRGSGAVGLIQFMPATAKDMGISTQKLGKMTHEQQLEWVYRYMNMYRKKYGDYQSLADFYLAILYPKARNQEACYVLYANPSKSYKQNIGLDEDKDGRVTVGDIDKRMKRMFPSAYMKKIPMKTGLLANR